MKNTLISLVTIVGALGMTLILSNSVSADPPPPLCTEPTCGDGILADTEECDDGNLMSGDLCSSSCTVEGPSSPLEAVCGDGLISDGEVCDDGNTNNGDDCNSTCSAANNIIFCRCLCRTVNRTNLCSNSNPTNNPNVRCVERNFGPNNPRTTQECTDAQGTGCQGYLPGTGARARGTIADCMPITTSP